MDPSWKSRPWPRRHWRPLLGLFIVVVIATAGVATFGSFFRIAGDLVAGSDGRIATVNTFTANGLTTIDIYAAPGIAGSAAVDLACTVVEPILVRDGYASAQFFVFDGAGDILATDETSCAGPSPSPSTNPAA
jgi:hypothetical protein